MGHDGKSASARPRGRIPPRTLILAAVVVVFAGAVLFKTLAPAAPVRTTDTSERPSMVRDDPVAAYENAVKTGRPIYVLFHSLTCQPCVEISAVADAVVPDYDDKVAFVNAITDDAGGEALASRFSFQYIPTSFFINANGGIVDSHTGVLTAEEMRARLDSLVNAQ